MSDAKRRLTKEERAKYATEAKQAMAAHTATAVDYRLLYALDDIDAADREIEFEKGEVKRYWNACDALEDEIERLRKALERYRSWTHNEALPAMVEQAKRIDICEGRARTTSEMVEDGALPTAWYNAQHLEDVDSHTRSGDEPWTTGEGGDSA